jgi:predicted transposase YbfD/YdcC
MEASAPQTLLEHFANLTDPRIERRKLHKLIDILVIAICATICGAETWDEFEIFGKAKYLWFKSFLELPNGIPSHDTFARVFARLDTQEFQHCFLQWVRSAFELSKGQLVAIDGKQSCGSAEPRAGKAAINTVSAWASENQLVLGQVQTQEKSNEITAVPELLRVLELSGCIVTLDAMGCQTAIVEQIVNQDADYVICVKGNQSNLESDIREYFDWALQEPFHQTSYSHYQETDGDHGRIEVRHYYASQDIEWLRKKESWKGLQSIAMVERQRWEAGERKSPERRYYISSMSGGAKEIGKAIRGHWGVENGLHWVLDVGFREDQSRIRKENAPKNMATLRHIALNLLKQEKSMKVGTKSKRLKAGWDEEYLLKVLLN